MSNSITVTFHSVGEHETESLRAALVRMFGKDAYVEVHVPRAATPGNTAEGAMVPGNQPADAPSAIRSGVFGELAGEKETHRIVGKKAVGDVHSPVSTDQLRENILHKIEYHKTNDRLPWVMVVLEDIVQWVSTELQRRPLYSELSPSAAKSSALPPLDAGYLGDGSIT